jgi:tRNA uridine 5-carboxymethylaminomethyl modification enzyme
MNFDVIVIGAGHAGIEAATAAARIGAKTGLITMNLSNFGELSCNPSIGGIGKGTVVKEVDALGGVMALAVDMSSIHRKVLNASKGAAVWGIRHQIDRVLYKKAINSIIYDYKNLEIIVGEVVEILAENGVVNGVELANGDVLKCKSVVCTTGTFLKGKILIGDERVSSGRINERAANFLTQSFLKFGLNVNRLKTGTPCRLNKNTIDFSGLEVQKSELEVLPMSYLNREINIPQVECFITHTNKKSHDIIINNLHRIPAMNGEIQVNGPRYCPSIETKIERFSDKERHQIFLEPEGLESDLIYPNGISTSMPRDMQVDFIASIKGLEKAKIEQFGYAIEYDFVDPRDVKNTLETKNVRGLFLAGQVIGTTGYEEAAGLGLVAGANAALSIDGGEFVLPRYNSYIGVMIDDLTTLGVAGEPYRLFTSRSEYRLSCRSDNADFRLTEIGDEVGLIDVKRRVAFSSKKGEFERILNLLNELTITPSALQKFDVQITQDGVRRTAFEVLQYKDVTMNDLRRVWGEIPQLSSEMELLVTTEAKYSQYIERQ